MGEMHSTKMLPCSVLSVKSVTGYHMIISDRNMFLYTYYTFFLILLNGWINLLIGWGYFMSHCMVYACICRSTPQCRYMAVYIFNCNICISLSFYPCTLILYSAPCGLPVFVNTQHGGKVLLLYPVMLLGSKPANLF